MAFLGGKRSLQIGIALIVLAFLFKGQVTDIAGDLGYYLALALGAVITVLGIIGMMGSVGSDDNLSEADLTNKVILHALARMTNADSNVMQVEVDAVRSTYNEITGEEISSKDIRVAALGELFEEKPFHNYLTNVEKKISVDSKKKIMKALSTVMESDGVVNPLEVEFFNAVAECLNLSASDLLELK